MGRVLIALLAALGIDIADKAVSAFISRYVNGVIDGLDQPGQIPDNNSEGSTTPYVPPSPVNLRVFLFGDNTVFRIYIDDIIKTAHELRKNILLSKSDILFTLNVNYKNSSLNELLYDLLDEKRITVTEKPLYGKITKSVGFSDYAVDHIIGLCTRIFTTYLKDSLIHHEQQISVVGLPHRVIICIDEAFRPGNIGFGSHIVAIPPVEEHTIYSAANQKDIFGSELIYGKVAIIKVKDTNSDVYTYCLVYPDPASFNYSITNAWLLKDANIDTWVEKFVPINSTDLKIKEMPFTFLETMIKKIY